MQIVVYSQPLQAIKLCQSYIPPANFSFGFTRHTDARNLFIQIYYYSKQEAKHIEILMPKSYLILIN